MTGFDPLHDPDFPDRPQHPDFWRMSQAALFLDGEANEGGKSIPAIHEGLVNLESLVYMAEQRVSALAQEKMGFVLQEQDPEVRALLLTIYIGAFTHGIVFQKEGGHHG